MSNKNKVLYLSAHEILEYDECRLFIELGYDVFSPGAYCCPQNRGDKWLRPDIKEMNSNPDVVEQYHKLGARFPGEDGKDHLTKEFVDNFDCVVVMHLPRWIENNWDAMKHKRVIWRTIGQSIPNIEAQIRPFRKKGLEIVRYSPKESSIQGFAGGDALIRFYKDPDEYGPWNGQDKKVVTFAQSMKQRGEACNFDVFERATRDVPRALFGPNNDEIGEDWAFGKQPYEKLKQEMRDSSVYFYTGTHPASYTLNFIEAFMSGIPIVAIGKDFGSGGFWLSHGIDLYEVHELLDHGATGLVGDRIPELNAYCKHLLENRADAELISKQARAAAIKIFGKETIKAQWKTYLEG